MDCREKPESLGFSTWLAYKVGGARPIGRARPIRNCASGPLKSVVFILNGPNLNLLGLREPSVYGSATLGDVETRARTVGESLGLEVVTRQSNHEGDLVDWIQEARTAAQGIVLNAGAYSHTSIAIQDAIRAAGVPVIEVHISNIHARESYRHHSYVSAVAAGVIVGCGIDGYEFALQALARRIAPPAPEILSV